MPLKFVRGKDGKKRGVYVPRTKPTSGASGKKISEYRKNQLDREQARDGMGGSNENNITRSVIGSIFGRNPMNAVDRARDATQQRILQANPDIMSDRYRRSLDRSRSIEPDAINSGFNFDNLFMGGSVDSRGEDEVRVNPEGGFVNNSGKVTTEDILRATPGISPEDITRAIGNTQFDPRVVGSIITPGMGYGDSAVGSYITGGEGVGGLMSDDNPIFDSYPDNTQAYNEMVGNTNKTLLGAAVGSGLPLDRPPPGMGNVFMERPSPGMGGQGGLLTDPRFNFDVASFGGTGFYDDIMLDAIQNSPFGSGISINPNLTPSTASVGFLGRNAASPYGTINIGNVGNVVDQFCNSLTGNAANAFIQSQFEALKRREQGERLRNFDLNIIQ